MIKIAFFDVDGTLLKLGSKEPSSQNCAGFTAAAGKRGLAVHGDWQRLSLRPAF